MSAGRRGFLQRLVDWFYVEEPAEVGPAAEASPAPAREPASVSAGAAGSPAAWAEPAGSEASAAPAAPLDPSAEPARQAAEFSASALPPRAASRVPQGPRGQSRAAWLVAALALAVAGVAIARGIPHAAPPPSRPAAAATATATATMTAAQLAAYVNQAKTAAANARASAQSAQAGAQQVSGLLASAQQDAQRVQAAASLTAARLAAAQDPSGGLAPLEQLVNQATQAVTSIESDATAADGSANAAASIAQTVADAVPAGDAAATSAQEANQALASAEQAAGQISDLLSTAQAAVAAWQQVHNAPRGVLGVTVRNPAPNLGVQGCEIVTVEAGGPGAQAGLVGATQRPNGVGDVVTSIADTSAAAKPFTIVDCAALQAAMARTRAGDKVDISYLRQQTFTFASQWVRANGSAVLGASATASAGAGGTATATASGSGTATGTATATAGCPAPITGTITPASSGSRIALFISLGGPGGQAPNLRAILDTGGVATSFPDGLLRQLGYKPYGTTQNSGVVPGATAAAYLYHVPGSAITVLDGGRQVPLATSVLNVIGIPGSSNYTLGPDILEGGSKLSTSGSRWSLTPPC